MRLSHLLCAALGATAVYLVLTHEKKEQGRLGATTAGTEPANDATTAAEPAERRRVRAGQPVTEPYTAAG